MAITYADYLFLKHLKAKKELPENPAVLELGKPNWYGDVDPEVLKLDVKDCPELLAKLNSPDCDIWTQSVVFFEWLFRPSVTTSIDLHGPAGCVPHDLNNPLPIWDDWYDSFDIIFNNGTGEHVFDQCQFFRTCHECCKVGGLMIHSAPLWGWTNHGFYSPSPCLFADLAAENRYGIVQWWWADLSPKVCRVFEIHHQADFDSLGKELGQGVCSMQFAALRKTKPDGFRVPRQGVYSDRLTPEMLELWKQRPEAK